MGVRHRSAPRPNLRYGLDVDQLVDQYFPIKSVGIFEAKTQFSALVEAVQHGEAILVTKMESRLRRWAR